jgi:PhnB protein
MANDEDYIPPGWPTIVPRLFAQDASGLVRFIKHVFAATGDFSEEHPTVLAIGTSRIMISEIGPRPQATAVLYVYVPNVDETHRRAVAAGARVVESPAEMPYGDRRSMVEDSWGNTWQIATYQRGSTN